MTIKFHLVNAKTDTWSFRLATCKYILLSQSHFYFPAPCQRHPFGEGILPGSPVDLREKHFYSSRSHFYSTRKHFYSTRGHFTLPEAILLFPRPFLLFPRPFLLFPPHAKGIPLGKGSSQGVPWTFGKAIFTLPAPKVLGIFREGHPFAIFVRPPRISELVNTRTNITKISPFW